MQQADTTGKTLVVTGASSDMGTALIKMVGEKYDRIVVQYRRMNDGLSSAIATLKAANIAVDEITADLAVGDDTLKTALNSLKDSLTGTEIHFAHFPAAPAINNRFHKTGWEPFETDLRVSLKSFIDASGVLIPLMQKTKGKMVLMISYVAENIPPKYSAVYVTVKYALLGLMKSLAVEYADKNITVNAVSPSPVETHYITTQPDMITSAWREKSPIGRNLTADEVAAPIAFLFSDEADRINGENIIVSGGMAAC